MAGVFEKVLEIRRVINKKVGRKMRGMLSNSLNFIFRAEAISVLKEKEEKQYGECRTRRFVLKHTTCYKARNLANQNTIASR
jgi:hypothetical protein